ncbi:MAG: aldehyde dehydrogenase family protein [Mycobacteriales bacterium]
MSTDTGLPALETFETVNPATEEVLGAFPLHGPAHVAAAVDQARIAAQWWAELGWDERRRRLMAWKGVLTRRVHQLCELMHRETGKPTGDAFIEAATAIEHLDWAARNARSVLRARRVSPGKFMLNQAASVRYQPYGVVAVIGPWNYPVLTPMGSIGYALAAGNSVVFKPSEFTPAVGEWLVRIFAEVVPEQPVLQLVTGFGETGSALCRSGVDKVAFTGSTATAKRVMAACAENLTPVLVECGGKDVLIVDSDADLQSAAEGAAWGGMSNAGQTCIGVERIYVVADVYDEFLRRLVEVVNGLRAGDDAGAQIGPITMPAQIDVIRRHVDDALKRGARAVVGGRESVRPPYVDPVVLVDVPEDSTAITEETFGPILTVNRVRDVDDAIDKANATNYGLSAAIYGKRRSMDAALRVRSGMSSINSVIAFVGSPAMPFGGVGESGFGRIHGADGLREFARAKSVTRLRFRAPLPLTTFARTPEAEARLARLLTVLHGRG